MNKERFSATAEWPLQPQYKEMLNARIQRWGERVVPALIGTSEASVKVRLFELLMTSVERDDRRVATLVEDLDRGARAYIEGPGPYGRGGGSIDSPPGIQMCINQFDALYEVFKAGELAATAESNET